MIKFKSFIVSIFAFIFISSGSFRKLTLSAAKLVYSKFGYTGGKMAEYIIDSLSTNAPWVKHVVSVAKTIPARKRYSYVHTTLKTTFVGTLRRKDVQEKLGIPFPGLFIISPSDKCNLKCTFCYSKDTRYSADMSNEQFNSIINHYTDYGVNYYLVTGGEPLVYPHLLDITKQHPSTVFFIYTNGTLLDKKTCTTISERTNIVPMISTDISADYLDSVRGNGVFAKIADAEILLASHKIAYGKSVVVNRQNLSALKNADVVQALFRGTCLAVMFVRYSGSDVVFALSDDEYLEFTSYIDKLRDIIQGIMFNFPELEFTYFGGCVRGKYLIHIRSNGDVESCPFAHEKIGNIFEKDLHHILLDMCSSGCNCDCGNCSQKCTSKGDVNPAKG